MDLGYTSYRDKELKTTKSSGLDWKDVEKASKLTTSFKELVGVEVLNNYYEMPFCCLLFSLILRI